MGFLLCNLENRILVRIAQDRVTAITRRRN